jgi:hypothetical protein
MMRGQVMSHPNALRALTGEQQRDLFCHWNLTNRIAPQTRAGTRAINLTFAWEV